MLQRSSRWSIHVNNVGIFTASYFVAIVIEIAICRSIKSGTLNPLISLLTRSVAF